MSRSSQCSTTGVTKAVVCAIQSGIVHIKRKIHDANQKVAHEVALAGFLSRYLNGLLSHAK